MIETNNSLVRENNLDRLSVLRITALWAFSESALGGILHALTLPLRGLFISSAAVLFISLIAIFSRSNREILKSTLIVILIKALVSPHTPFTAYFAVGLQGVLGYLLFFSKRFYKASSILLGISVLFFSGLQKIIILTILFGNTLWNSIDIFIKQISNEFFNIVHPDINYGLLLILGYISLHILAGIFIGFYASKLPDKINHYRNVIPDDLQPGADHFPEKKGRKKRSWLLRPTGILIIIVSAGVIILSYFSPELENTVALSVLLMLLRSIIITLIWYALLVPVVNKIFKKFIANKKSKYLHEIEGIISMFPQFKNIVSYCWIKSVQYKGPKRISVFLSTSFYYLLMSK